MVDMAVSGSLVNVHVWSRTTRACSKRLLIFQAKHVFEKVCLIAGVVSVEHGVERCLTVVEALLERLALHDRPSR